MLIKVFPGFLCVHCEAITSSYSDDFIPLSSHSSISSRAHSQLILQSERGHTSIQQGDNARGLWHAPGVRPSLLFSIVGRVPY